MFLLERSSSQRVELKAEGCPKDLIEGPPNLSAALFLSSPPMNLFKGILQDEGRVGISSGILNGEEVVVGVRPRDLEIRPEAGVFVSGESRESEDCVLLKAQIIDSKYLDGRWLYDLEIESTDVRLLAKGGERLVRAESAKEYQVGEVDVAVRLDRAHVFEIPSGIRVRSREVRGRDG
jgi:ABC-type sugar transport system ATPase subunit